MCAAAKNYACEHDDQRRGTAGMHHGSKQRPAQQYIAQPGRHLQQSQAGQPLALATQGRHAVKPEGQRQHGGKHHIGAQAMDVMDGRQRLEADVGAIMAGAQFAPEREPLAEIHGRPQRAWQLGKSVHASTA